MQLSNTAAQRLMLAAMDLDKRPQHPATKEDVRDLIRNMGALQIDTIHVVARSPYLVLWSRLGDYDPRWLDELLAEGKIFEYWSHAACFLPIEDYPLYRRMQLDRGWVAGETRLFNRAPDWIRSHEEMVEKLRSLLSQEEEQERLREAIYRRITSGPNTYRDRLHSMLQQAGP